ncbi:MAG TPA: DnaJ domain-containing protein [Thermoanaerobaculia bacterium]|nr:DnaJ domain-containing protein [Thermoanaerobaculia bacterium]
MEAHRQLTDEEYRLFSERVARSLAERPLAVGHREHREQVAQLLKQLGDETFYHILGIDPATKLGEVHDAYDRIARIVHPSHARRLSLEGREEVLKLLFERATLAYLTLSDTDRRKAYDRHVGPVRWTSLRMTTASREEEAKRFFEQAQALAGTEQYHAAIELLRQSVRLKATAGAYALLGQLLAKNPQWLGDALEALERAEDMGSTDPELPAALKEVRGKLASPAPSRKPKSG